MFQYSVSSFFIQCERQKMMRTIINLTSETSFIHHEYKHIQMQTITNRQTR